MNFVLVRSYSTFNKVKKSAKLIRNEFLDYFKNDLEHTIIRSSPVTPLNDQTLAFVNAGMNQVCLAFMTPQNIIVPPISKHLVYLYYIKNLYVNIKYVSV